MNNFINYNYYLLNNFNYYKKIEIVNIILFILSCFYFIIYLLILLNDRLSKTFFFILTIDFSIFEINIIYLINLYRDIDDNAEFLMKYEDLLNSIFKELTLFILNRKLIIISFHFSTFSYTLRLLSCFLRT